MVAYPQEEGHWRDEICQVLFDHCPDLNSRGCADFHGILNCACGTELQSGLPGETDKPLCNLLQQIACHLTRVSE